MSKRWILALAAAAIIVSPIAPQDIKAYIYDEAGYAVPCPRPYLFEEFLDFAYLPAGALLEPEDFFLSRDGTLYVADTGNGRIVKIDRAGNLLLEITHETVAEPTGLFVRSDTDEIYVADGSGEDILVFDQNGELVRTYLPPSSEVLREDYIYAPSKVLVDQRGWIYVIGTGTSTGIVMLDDTGTFRGFYGANRASSTLLRRLARIVASEEQRQRMLLQTLLPASNFALDDRGFIYTVTREMETNQIRRLNAIGLNTYPEGVYGEQNVITARTVRPPQLSAVDVNDEGVISVLDDRSGKISQYNLEGDLLFVFGGNGETMGTFVRAKDIAVDRQAGVLYVLDSEPGGIHIFRPTEFAGMVYRASRLFYDGRYEDALELWASILERDSNYPLAHKGVGKALTKLGRRYESMRFLDVAMRHYEFSGDRESYSQAFTLYRQFLMRQYFGYVILILAGVVVGIWAFSRFAVPFIKDRVLNGRTELVQSLGILGHPFDTLENVKYNYTGVTVANALAVLLLVAAVRVLHLYATSFHFTMWNPDQISVVSELSRILLPWISWVVANWLITLILDGEGSLGKIFAFSAYGMVPFVLLTVLAVIMSHILSLGELGVYRFLQSFMYAWVGLLILLGVGRVHNYTTKGSVGVAALSVVSIVLLWGVVVLLYGLIGGFFDFIGDVIREASYHV